MCEFSFSFLKDESQAEDIVQELFIKIWENPSLIKDVTKGKSYLYSCVRNASIDELRKSNKHLKVNIECEEQDIERKIIEDEVKKELYTLVNSLPEKCKKVFLKSVLYKSYYKNQLPVNRK